MTQPGIKVNCNAKECAFYHYDEKTGNVYCTHPEKRYYLKSHPCPLFRIDWQEKMKQLEIVEKKLNERKNKGESISDPKSSK